MLLQVLLLSPESWKSQNNHKARQIRISQILYYVAMKENEIIKRSPYTLKQTISECFILGVLVEL